MIGPKREEAKGDWRKLHNGELLDLYPTYLLTPWRFLPHTKYY